MDNEQAQICGLAIDEGRSVSFTGPPGSGKSLVIAHIASELQRRHGRSRVAVTASTGLAALKVDGTTIFNFAGIGLGEGPVAELLRQMHIKVKQRWAETQVLIIDEASPISAELFDKLEHIARKIKGNGKVFGGIQLVVTGDFISWAPFGVDAGCTFNAESWKAALPNKILLKHNYRHGANPELVKAVEEMSLGNISDSSLALIQGTEHKPASWSSTATELVSSSEKAASINDARLAQLPGDEAVYVASDSGVNDPLLLSELYSKCRVPDVVEYKKGAKVMLTRDVNDLLVNGLDGTVVCFQSKDAFNTLDLSVEQLEKDSKKIRGVTKLPVVRLVIPGNIMTDMLADFETWTVEGTNGTVRRTQLPLMLSWAMAFGASQGQTLSKVTVDCESREIGMDV